MEFTEGCLICGEELVYTEEVSPKSCVYCGQTFETNVSCPDDHFICDTCHSSPAFDIIENFCNHTRMTDPLEIAEIIMKHKQIKMHGPEHHYLVPAALISAYFNQTENPGVKPHRLRIARKRAEKVPGGFCGTHGNCGAAVGTGIFISIITGSTPLAEKEWQLSNLATGQTLLAIAAEGGPRCCKRDSYIAIRKGSEFLKQNLKINLPLHEVVCEYSHRNKQCTYNNCRYYGG